MGFPFDEVGKVVAKQSMFPLEPVMGGVRPLRHCFQDRRFEINAGVSAWVGGPAYAQVPGALVLQPTEGWRVSCYLLRRSLIRSVKVMKFTKFNPYAVLLTTGLLMLATVLFAQTRSSVALLKAGVVSMDRDVSSFAATLLSSESSDRPAAVAEEGRASRTRVASTDSWERRER